MPRRKQEPQKVETKRLKENDSDDLCDSETEIKNGVLKKENDNQKDYLETKKVVSKIFGFVL